MKRVKPPPPPTWRERRAALKNFFTKEIWQEHEENLTTGRKILFRTLKIFIILLSRLSQKEFLTLASSLTFYTVFSMVPLLAVTFSLAKGLGIQQMLEPLLLQYFIGDVAQDTIPQIIRYVEQTNVKALGSVGVLFLLFTAITVLGNIETAFNRIWGVRQPRSFLRKCSEYISLLTVAPLLVAAAIGISTTLQSHAVTRKLLEIGLFAGAMKVFLFFLPLLCIIIALTFLYLFLPHTRVRFIPAFTAGTLAGIVWIISQYLYVSLQVGISKYNAIYGTFASLPILLLWIYISWIIVLIGAEVSFAVQNVRQFLSFDTNKQPDSATIEKISFAVLKEICRGFEYHRKRETAEEIANSLKLPPRLVNEATGRLISMKYILAVEEENTVTYVPAHPPKQIKLHSFFNDFHSLSHHGALELSCQFPSENEEVFTRKQQAVIACFKEESFQDMLKKEEKKDAEHNTERT